MRRARHNETADHPVLNRDKGGRVPLGMSWSSSAVQPGIASV